MIVKGACSSKAFSERKNLQTLSADAVRKRMPEGRTYYSYATGSNTREKGLITIWWSRNPWQGKREDAVVHSWEPVSQLCRTLGQCIPTPPGRGKQWWGERLLTSPCQKRKEKGMKRPPTSWSDQGFECGFL